MLLFNLYHFLWYFVYSFGFDHDKTWISLILQFIEYPLGRCNFSSQLHSVFFAASKHRTLQFLENIYKLQLFCVVDIVSINEFKGRSYELSVDDLMSIVENCYRN